MTQLPIPTSSLLRIPQQQRSTETIHLIMDVAWTIVTRDGLAGLTTNKIAEESGVNIAGIYKYFANKEMILSGLIELHLLQQEQAIKALVQPSSRIDFRTFCTQSFDTVFAMLMPMRSPIQELLAGSFVLGEATIAGMLTRTFSQMLQQYLHINQDNYRLIGGPSALYVLSNSITMTLMQWIVANPTYITLADIRNVLLDQLIPAFVEEHACA